MGLLLSRRKEEGGEEKNIGFFEKLNFLILKVPLPIHIVMSSILALQGYIGYKTVERIADNYKNRVQEITHNKPGELKKERIIIECGNGVLEIICQERKKVEYNHPYNNLRDIEETIARFKDSEFRLERKLGIKDIDLEGQERKNFGDFTSELQERHPEIKGKLKTSFNYNISSNDLEEIKDLLQSLGYQGEFEGKKLREFLLKLNIFNDQISEKTKDKFFRLYGKIYGSYDLKEIHTYNNDYINFLLIGLIISLIPTLMIYFKGLPKLGKRRLIRNLPKEEHEYMQNSPYSREKENEFDYIRVVLGMRSFNEFKKLNGFLISLPPNIIIDTSSLGKKFIFKKNESGVWEVKNGYMDNITHLLEGLGIQRNNIENFVKYVKK